MTNFLLSLVSGHKATVTLPTADGESRDIKIWPIRTRMAIRLQPILSPVVKALVGLMKEENVNAVRSHESKNGDEVVYASESDGVTPEMLRALAQQREGWIDGVVDSVMNSQFHRLLCELIVDSMREDINLKDEKARKAAIEQMMDAELEVTAEFAKGLVEANKDFFSRLFPTKAREAINKAVGNLSKDDTPGKIPDVSPSEEASSTTSPTPQPS